MLLDKRSRSPLSKAKAKTRKRYAIFAVIATATLGWGSFLKFGLPLLIPAIPSADAGMADNLLPLAAIPQTNEPTYQTYELENATVHVVSLLAGTQLSVAVADGLETVEDFAQQENALAVINGGFFDPQNGKTTSHLILQGNTIGDPSDNERLVGNPDLQSYLDQILNRSEFRTYQCRTSSQASEMKYEIAAHSDLSSSLANTCTLVDLIGAGPQLLPADTSYEEGFTDYKDGERVRDALGGAGPNARSAIALTADNAILLLMVAQRSDAPGLTLLEVAEFAASLGAVSLLNLDGGSSSTLYYNGQTHLGRLDADGNAIERPVKSVIVVGP